MSGAIRYRQENADRHDNLVLPDGRSAAAVRLIELKTIMAGLGIPIDPSMGKAWVLDKYAAYVAAKQVIQ